MVPVEVDGVALDAAGAPIISANSAGGYMSVNNLGRQVDTWFFWEAAHCIDMDPHGFIAWVEECVR